VAEPSPHALRGYALALFAGVTWAGAGLISEWMRVDPMVLTGARTLSSAAILGLGMLLFDRGSFKIPVTARSLGWLLLFGVIAMAGNQAVYFESIKYNGAALGTLLKYLAPVFMLVIGALFYKRRIRPLAAIAAVVALIGQALAVGLFSGKGMTLTPTGLGWGLLCAAFFVTYSLMGSAGNARFKPVALLFYGMLIAAVFWMVVLGPARVVTPFTQVKPLLQLLLLASVSTVAPFLCYLLAMRDIDPARAGIAAMIEPVAAGIGGFLFFGEPLGAMLLVGGVVSLAAIVLIRLSDIRSPDK